MQLRYKKFWYNETSQETMALNANTEIYKTEYIGTIKYTSECELGESFDYIILTDFSEELYEKLDSNIKCQKVLKVKDKILLVLLGAYIDEQEYPIKSLDEFPVKIIKNCYILHYLSYRAIRTEDMEEYIKLKSNPIAIDKIIGLKGKGFDTIEITLASWVNGAPIHNVFIGQEVPFSKVDDKYNPNCSFREDIFTDENLSEMFNKYLNQIYEEAKAD